MYFVGIDIGSLTGKSVVTDGDGQILGSHVILDKKNPMATAREVLDGVLEKVGMEESQITYCVGTGYGRRKIPLADETISEITCHGTGAHFLVPSLRTIIDIGGQDCKVIRLDDRGNLQNFIMNEKCAAGTGRYLEIMAKTLKLSLEELGPVSLKAKTPVSLLSKCSIYAQADVLSLIGEGHKVPDLAAGINKAMAERVIVLAEKVGIQEDITVSGGVAKNIGVVNNMEKLLGVKFTPLPVDPQIVGALGAALVARKAFEKKGNGKQLVINSG
ncbi:MAG: acyl-CoA dehydratase activase [Promethearchaeota archaeon]